jgi:hypothetical protein
LPQVIHSNIRRARERLARCLEGLGPVAIKTGQLLSTRADIFGVEFAGDLARLTLAALLENFGYRQLNNLWRIQGTWEYLRGVGGWGEMTRRGIGAPKPGG